MAFLDNGDILIQKRRRVEVVKLHNGHIVQ